MLLLMPQAFDSVLAFYCMNGSPVSVIVIY